jgi:hypothetical protein
MQDRVKLGDGSDNILTFADIPANINTVPLLCAYLEAGAPADISASDTATVAGTPLNKATLLKDATAEALGLDSSAVPDDAFNALIQDNHFTTTFPTGAAGGTVTVTLDSTVKIADLKLVKVQDSASAAAKTAWLSAGIILSDPTDGAITVKRTIATTTAVPLDIYIIRAND